ncbi:MAG: M24 family metallopeptidase [Planctomycetota bacterium]|nr:MAG: M24 family metallopeptidase [Planctomycetota bacterium]
MYRQHRERFLALLKEQHAVAVVPTATPKTRNHDSEYRFRPDSDFWYLTGFAEPESVLVILPSLGEDESDEIILFLRESDRDKEVWTGRRLGIDRAASELAIDLAFPIEELWTRLPDLLSGYERIVYSTGQDEETDRQMIRAINTLRRKARGGLRPPVELIDHVPLVHELRLFKDEREIECMRRAAEITTEAHLAAMAETQPGVREHEIDALLDYTFRRRGSTGPAYGNIVAGGANACILHYHENDQELRDGELLLIDAGAEWSYYASDVTRTFPVNGTFSPEQRAIYEVVLEAQLAGIEQVKPDVSFISIHEAALAKIVDGLLALGLLEGSRADIIEHERYKRFYMHKTGHWLGLDVHDCGYYSEDGRSRALKPGMTLTVEPGIYVAADDETVDARWRGIGVRIEDDLLVTEAGHEILTEKIPKSIEDVEAACRGAFLVGAQ